MVKSFLMFAILQIFLVADQLIVVVAENNSTHKAKLYCIEKNSAIYKNIDVNLGRNGLAFDSTNGIFKKLADEPDKKEGDGKTPIGIYSIESGFGYSHTKTALTYNKTPYNLICIDDTSSEFYNKILPIPQTPLKSFELMYRDDDQYKLGLVLSHNKNGLKGNGSCIFVHIQKEKDAPTAGCVSMSEGDLRKILLWLDRDKNPTILHISKEYLPQVYDLYPKLQGLLN
ncbi:MAG: L,D-transpeptidase family protein [Sulfurimonadaceae bacterium]|jgi:L,D-peptidoglycan transpeptidase YkuD (ErfK/YbiS/YcfS/YnhG family)|nr:L,D-transpeptidase family protein [Sulfurimonadaceae bacterium]